MMDKEYLSKEMEGMQILSHTYFLNFHGIKYTHIK